MAIAYLVLFCCPDFLGAAKSCALSKIKGGDNTGSIHPLICGSRIRGRISMNWHHFARLTWINRRRVVQW
jgi:hypothetical protein